MTATTVNPAWKDAYTNGSVGGLIGEALSPVGGFGKFCLVLLGLSIVANNIPNNYSVFPKNDDLTIAGIICSSSWELGY
jgi:purine-cytosine permease-like protein